MPTQCPVRLFSYKMTHDVGFAPNPFNGVFTLATCKPRMRESKRVGDWIAGFTSKRLNGDEVGNERLVYLVQVADKMRFEDYHTDPRFAGKIPVPSSKRLVERVGDNIYGRKRDGSIFQLPNPFHTIKDVAHDTDGLFVLAGTSFAYFGSEPLIIPDEVRPDIPASQSAHGARTKDPALAQAFIDFVLARGTGIHAAPTSWKAGDRSWLGKGRCG